MRNLAMVIVALALGCDGGERCRWETEIVDQERIGGSTALAVSASGEVHVGYVNDEGGRDVRHAMRGEGGWTVERVDPGTYAGFDLSLAVDAAGQVHVAYGDNSSPASVSVHHAIRGAGGWTRTESLAGGNATDQSLALDPTGTAHVAFSGGSSVSYARRPAGEEWERVVLDSGRQPRLAVDAEGRVHVTYNDPIGGAVLGHAVLDGGAWSTSVVDSGAEVGAQSAIAIGSDGSVHLAYRAGTTLRYAVHRGDWTIETVEAPEGRPVRPSIAIDAAGAVHILYADGDGVGLYHARLIDGAWTTLVVDGGDLATLSIGNGALAVDADGALHASYRRGARQGNRTVNHPWYARLSSCDPR